MVSIFPKAYFLFILHRLNLGLGTPPDELKRDSDDRSEARNESVGNFRIPELGTIPQTPRSWRASVDCDGSNPKDLIVESCEVTRFRSSLAILSRAPTGTLMTDSDCPGIQMPTVIVV